MRRELDSSVQRLWELLQREYLDTHQQKRDRRLFLSTRAIVRKLNFKDDRVTGIECLSTRDDQVVDIRAKIIILAASPLESARLVMDSELKNRSKSVAALAGRYLAEHLLCTAEIPVPFDSLAGGRVSVVVPPSTRRELIERFQIDVKNATFKDGSGGKILRIFGFAAMDPNRENRAFSPMTG
jgi:choline dehydrogenase-like flavoprotein